jgi:tetratricopeptide (TPR) repeat protein
MPRLRSASARADVREAASEALQQLESLASADSRVSNSVAAIEIRSWAHCALGKMNDAVAALQPLAERQAKLGKSEVEIPAREMLADMLLLSGRPAEALTQYRRSLLSDPNRFNALLGAGQAAERLGRNHIAATYYRQLLANCRNADGGATPQLNHARTTVSGH